MDKDGELGVDYDMNSDRRHSYGVVLVGTSELFREGVRRLLQGTDFHTLASAPSVDQLPELHGEHAGMGFRGLGRYEI
jgi:hypothetical protein